MNPEFEHQLLSCIGRMLGKCEEDECGSGEWVRERSRGVS